MRSTAVSRRRKTGNYAWIATGTTGPIADVPLPLELEVVPDSAPHVELVSPATDTIVAGDDRITLRATATRRPRHRARRAREWKQGPTGGAQPPATQRLADASATVWDGSAVLDLAPRGLKPGDALHVKIVATDNSPWAQRGESRELLLKIPTMEERRAIARDVAGFGGEPGEVGGAGREVARSSARATRRAIAAQRSRAGCAEQRERRGDKKGSMSYDAAEKAKAVAKDQRALADQVKHLQQTAAALEQQLKQAGALDSASRAAASGSAGRCCATR